MKRLIVFAILALALITLMIPVGMAETLTDVTATIEEAAEIVETTDDQPAVIEEPVVMPAEAEEEAHVGTSEPPYEGLQAEAEAEESPSDLYIDEDVVDAADIALSGDEPIVIDEMTDDAALVGVIERAATAPTLDITPFDDGYVIVKNASAYPRLYARVAWRFIDLMGEGMLIVSTSFVDTDTGEVEIVKPQVSGTFDYCQIIITDTKRPSTKRPAQVNQIIMQTIKANVPAVQTVTLSQSSTSRSARPST